MTVPVPLRPPARLPPLGIGAAMVLIACGSGPSQTAGSWGGTIDTLPGGAVLIRNPRAGAWSPETAWTVELRWQIGSPGAEGPAQFGAIRSLAPAGNGRIAVLDGVAQEVRVFDSTGTHVRTFGRPGGGPGEIRRGMALAGPPGGGLWVLDPPNNRISVFDSAGGYVGSRFLVGTFFTTRWEGGFDRAGRYYDHLMGLTPDGRRGVVLVRGAPDAPQRDTIWGPVFDGPVFVYNSPDGFSSSRVSIPFTARSRWRRGPDGRVWSTITDRYRIVLQADDGDTLRIIERVGETVPVRAADLASALDEIRWFVDEGGRIDRSRIPERKPALVDFFLTPDGYLWVIPSRPAPLQNRVLDVFDPFGRFLGALDLPVRLSADPKPRLIGRSLYAVAEDALGVQSLVRLDVHRPR